jgi:hypothetical protein
VRAVDAGELDVRAVREPLVVLDRGPEPKELVVVGRVANDRVWVADRDGHHLVLLSVDVERLLLPHLDGAHLGLDLLAVAHRRHDLARPDFDPDAIETVSPRQPAGGDPRPVSGQLRGRAVGIPDDDLRRVTVRRQHFDDAVRADAEVVVADLLHALGRQRQGKLSPLDQQVVVAEPVPLRELHPRPRPEGDRQAG